MSRQIEMNASSTRGEDLVKTLPPGGRIEYRARWLEPAAADALLVRLRAEIPWVREPITMFGRTVMQPRRLCFMGDAGVVYRYSGRNHAALDWHPAVAALLPGLERACERRFNCVLLNQYRDGRDSMGWHADDEPELGPAPVIASLSLGAPRRFMLRRRERCSGKRGDNCERRFELSPGHGSLLVMRGDLQRHWHHQVPRTRRPVGERINLTFRRVLREPG